MTVVSTQFVIWSKIRVTARLPLSRHRVIPPPVLSPLDVPALRDGRFGVCRRPRTYRRDLLLSVLGLGGTGLSPSVAPVPVRGVGSGRDDAALADLRPVSGSSDDDQWARCDAGGSHPSGQGRRPYAWGGHFARQRGGVQRRPNRNRPTFAASFGVWWACSLVLWPRRFACR